ncbi:hypothetical protein JRQ81_017756 [Phrynocephalus forsythii]|uniref:Uncharacterized protein n=1 Tax=Phrynocephalus forsythii TaxID=171643 RepID=A0A9Q0XQY4_9SAUR|nr:hypothetical protein JRQ81_017756 [Phrynocephalus forsythii]
MSDEITNDGNIVEEDSEAVEQEHPVGCLQLSALCCCIPRRRRRLPGRRPKDRKKKNDKKKNAGDASFSDNKSEERKQNMGQDYRGMTSAGDSWDMTSEGDTGSIQTEGIKPALTVCIQINDRTADLFIPVTLGDICLEGRGEENAEKTSGNTLCTEGKIQQQMEKPESVFLEPEKESVEGAVLEGVPLEEGKGHVITPAKENMQCGRPELLSEFLQGPTSKKESQGAENIILKLENLSSEEEKEKDQLELPFQELQQSRQLAISSISAANENKLDEEHLASTYSEGENFLPDQKSVLCNVPVGLHEVFLELTCKVDRQLPQNQIIPVDKGDAQNKDEGYQEISNEEMKRMIEPECPDVFPPIGGNKEWQEQQNLEASSNNVEHRYLNVLEQKDQPPVTPKVPKFSLQATTHEKTQEVQTIKSSSSDVGLRKAREHQCRSHQKYEEVAAPNYRPLLPTGLTSKMDLQNLTHTAFLPEDVGVHITDQKHTETHQQLLLEQTSRCCDSEADGQETQSPIITEDSNIHLDNLNHEKEQQRKLECGDSEPEGVCDKKDQDNQGTVYLEMQQPSVFAEPLKTIPGEDQCVRKEDVSPGQAEIHLLDEVPTETDDQCKMHIFASAKEKATTQQQKKQQPTMFTQEGHNKEEKQPESWLIQKNTSLPYEEQQKGEHMNLDVTGEAPQKEKQDLSDITFLYNTREDGEEGDV